jgi:Rad3-related DNA helicases
VSKSAYERFFPYEKPFPNQREAMDRIANALTREQDVLLEGAPGTGKTLAALVPALQEARESGKTVVITTNVHQQMRQFVADAQAITQTEPIRAVVFKGKGEMCHIDVDYQECQTLRDTTRSVVETRQDKQELEARSQELLAASQDGDLEATQAREAVMSELQELEDELDGIDGSAICEYYRANLTRDTEPFYDWLYDDVRTPEEVYEHAEQEGFCGYELLKEGVEGVDLAVCNYHHLLDPTIREQFFRWLDCDPSDVITVFDEAHNLEAAAREHATQTLTENTLRAALDELDETDDARAEAARNVLEPFCNALVDTVDESLGFGDREQIGDNWEDISIANDSRRDDLTLSFLRRYEGQGIDTELELATQLGRHLDEVYEEAYRSGDATTRRECQTLQAAGFVDRWLAEGTELGQYPVAAVRRDAGTDEVYGQAELYTCIPREVTSELFDEVSTSVLMSATLRPFDVTENVLGLTDPVSLSYSLVYPEANRRTYAVDTPPLFASEREDLDTQAAITKTLEDAIKFTPGNTLAFFPSYSEATRYHERLTSSQTGRGTDLGNLMLDEAGMSTEDLRQRFVNGDDATLFTSLWGTLSEGVSFDGDQARTVAVVGVPYPHLSERIDAVQDAYDRTFADREYAQNPGWAYAVEIPTIRKTRQALGRVIRSPDDFGARVLIDRRYTEADMGKYSVRDAFPADEREEIVSIDREKLRFAMLNFYADRDAYHGAPPEP